jgi:hypothetical protein
MNPAYDHFAAGVVGFGGCPVPGLMSRLRFPGPIYFTVAPAMKCARSNSNLVEEKIGGVL